MKKWFRCLQHGTAALVPALGVGAGNGARAAQPSPMNVVLILADDLGWTDLACYSSKLYETPNIDRLAQQGVSFTQPYSAALFVRRRGQPL